MQTPWAQIHDRFNPEEPVQLHHPAWRVARRYSPAEQLRPALGRPFGKKHYLMLGTVGSGKSTELLSVAEARVERDLVVVVDLHDFFARRLGDEDALDHVQPWEVLFLVGLHIYRAGEALGHRWAPGRAKALAAARLAFEPDPPPTLDVAKLAQGLMVLVGGTLAAVEPASAAVSKGLRAVAASAQWQRQLRIGRRELTPDQDDRVRALGAAVHALIGDLNERGKPVACFIDGLDRIGEPATVERLFVRSTLLAELPCPTLATGPILVRHLGLGAAVRGFTPVVLANIPVMDPLQPLQPTELGARFFQAVWAARTTDLGCVQAFTPDALARLGWASGGRVREFMKLIQQAVGLCYDAGVDGITPAIADKVVDAARRNLEMGLTQQDLAQLRSARDERLPPDDGAQKLLRSYWLLPYPNERTWYFPHPLLFMQFLDPPTADPG